MKLLNKPEHWQFFEIAVPDKMKQEGGEELAGQNLQFLYVYSLIVLLLFMCSAGGACLKC